MQYRLLLSLCGLLLAIPVIAQSTITCTEINYNSDPSTASGNWLELHNFGSSSVSLAGYKFVKGTSTYTIPNAGSNIAAGGYLVLSDNVAQFQQAYPGVNNVVGPTQISLGNGGDTVEIRQPNGTVLLTIGYDDANGWPRCPDGFGRTLEFRYPDTNAGLMFAANWRTGCMRGSPGTGYTPCQEPLFFNEINYRSSITQDAGDWVELWNRSNQTINLSGWTFRDSRDTLRFTIPNGTTLPANEYLVIYQDLAKFQSVHGNDAPRKVGPFQFALDGGGEAIRLFDTNEKLFLSMAYNDKAPWPLAPDGTGPTLELRAPFTDLNEGANWAASCLFGTPGRLNSECSTDATEAIELSVAHVMPNPSSGVFTVEISDSASSNRQWQITDWAGRIIKNGVVHASDTNWLVDLQSYPSGMYVLQVSGMRPTRLAKL
jgi:Lamin Tail Domain/Secretion system C-terminal sorting domain